MDMLREHHHHGPVVRVLGVRQEADGGVKGDRVRQVGDGDVDKDFGVDEGHDENEVW